MKAETIWQNLEKVRKKAPLVHNITNYVVMNSTANALLAIGASPVMAHAIEEVADMTKLAQALVINIGTLSEKWIEAMNLAMKAAKEKGIPIIFDPVGAGATNYRTKTSLEIIHNFKPEIIRGNASEIRALINSDVKTKGVDSIHNSDFALTSAQEMAEKNNCIVVVSGEIDIITNYRRTLYVKNGHHWLPKITGSGCTSTALVAAFCAVNSNFLQAAANAMSVMGISGEIAAKISQGPASLQMNLIDTFFDLTKAKIQEYLR